MKKFEQQTSAPGPQSVPPTYADRQFLHTFLAGAFLPLVQATMTAAMAGIATLTLLYIFNAVDIVKPMLIVSAVVWVVTWLYLLRRWLSLTALERLTGIDINGDGQIGKPKAKAEPLVIRLDEVDKGHYRQRMINIDDVTAEQLTEFARGMLAGRPFTEREWTGKGKPFSSGQGGSFRRFRSNWLKHGFVTIVSDKDNRQGFDFTDSGWAMIVKLAGVVPEPISDDQFEVEEDAAKVDPTKL